MSLRRFAVGAVAASALAACGGGSGDSGPPVDPNLDRASRAGAQAMSMGMAALAVRQYKAALAQAYQRDDAEAIADSGYNLALAQMKANDPKAAVATVQEVQAELDRRGARPPAELFLVQAAASYRSANLDAARAAAQQAIAATASDPDTVYRAWFINGLVAADRGDAATLEQAIATLVARKPSAGGQADLAADLQELQGRAALQQGRVGDALGLFEQSAANRQQALDYRTMARALSLAGDAALRSDQAAKAADFYLRAGRSALLQGDGATAEPWLKQAERLARQTGQPGIVEEIARLRKAVAVRSPSVS